MLDFLYYINNILEEQNKSTEDLFNSGIISKNTFYKYKQRYPSLATLIKIANYLEVSIDYIFERNDKNTFSTPYVYSKEIFYKNLTEYIKSNNISQLTFCKDLNYSKDNIMRWKTRTIPSVLNLIEIANYFNCNVDDLLL